MERHRAVVAGPDGDPVAVEDLGDVVRVDARQVERHDAAAQGRVQRAVELDVRAPRAAASRGRRRRARARARGRRPCRGPRGTRRRRPSPIASPTAGVPASNFQGMSLKSVRRRWTSRIISPPARNGGIASSSSRRAHSAPGAHRGRASCGRRTRRSRRRAPGRRPARAGTAWAPSTRTSAPAAWAISTISRTGLIVPSVFETWVKATSFGLSRRRTSKTSRRRSPSSVIGMNSRSPSFSWTRSCHGTRLAWCSISVRTIASPRSMFRRPHE